MDPLRFLSVCSGIDCASAAWKEPDFTAVAFSEIEAAPCAVLRHRYTATPNLGDMTEIDGRAYRGLVDVLVGGTPCFVAGTLILAKRGLVPIESVVVGDEVLTHKNRWRKVTATMRKNAPTVILRGQGHNGLETTREHPFWSRTKKFSATSRAGKTLNYKIVSDPEWANAGDMLGRFWATPTAVSEVGTPQIDDTRNHEGRNMPTSLGKDFFWLVGAWVGDGWVRDAQRSKRPEGQTSGYVCICGNKKDQHYLAERIAATGLHASVSQERTTVRFQISSKPLTRWLVDNFGKGCSGKTIPAWLFGESEENKRAFLDGYLFADGCVGIQKCGGGTVRKIATVNKSLVVGVRLIAASLGVSTTVVLSYPKRRLLIEGRAVNEKPLYSVSMYEKSRSAFVSQQFMWGKVRSVFETNEVKEVYNFEVEEDNSYVADAIVVHNCQSYSKAGLRQGLHDARGNLTLHYVRLADEIDPGAFVWENVPGVLSDHTNAFGCLIGYLAGDDDPATPGDRPAEGKSSQFWKWDKKRACHVPKWPPAGWVVGPKRIIAWRVLDAQWFGVAQRRSRVFVVGCPRSGGCDPRRILFEPEGLCGNPPSREHSRKAASDAAGLGTDGCVGRTLAFGGNNTQGPIDVTPALTTNRGTHNPGDFEAGTLLVAFPGNMSSTQYAAAENICPALGAKNPTAIAYVKGTNPHSAAEAPTFTETDLAAYLNGWDERHDPPKHIIVSYADLRNRLRVRRLTPTECERLMGYEDGFTLVPWTKGKMMPNGHRYRMLGNSMVRQVMEFIGQRILQEWRSNEQA